MPYRITTLSSSHDCLATDVVDYLWYEFASPQRSPTVAAEATPAQIGEVI